MEVAADFPLVAILEHLHWGPLESAIVDECWKFQSVGFGEKERKNLGVEWRILVER